VSKKGQANSNSVGMIFIFHLLDWKYPLRLGIERPLNASLEEAQVSPLPFALHHFAFKKDLLVFVNQKKSGEESCFCEKSENSILGLFCGKPL